MYIAYLNLHQERLIYTRIFYKEILSLKILSLFSVARNFIIHLGCCFCFKYRHIVRSYFVTAVQCFLEKVDQLTKWVGLSTSENYFM